MSDVLSATFLTALVSGAILAGLPLLFAALGESVGIEKIKADYSKALYAELEKMIEQEKLVDIFYERAFERLIPQGYSFRIPVSDTQAYRQFGNSVVVPAFAAVAKLLASRIKQAVALRQSEAVNDGRTQ